MAPFSLALKHALEKQRLIEQQARILREVSLEQPLEQTMAGGTAAGDRARLRGLPAIGRGVSGAIRGTQPEADALRKLS